MVLHIRRSKTDQLGTLVNSMIWSEVTPVPGNRQTIAIPEGETPSSGRWRGCGGGWPSPASRKDLSSRLCGAGAGRAEGRCIPPTFRAW